jgi:hypothetical protein
VSGSDDTLEDFDLVWIASDQNGHVAAFITAGSGSVMAPALEGIFDVEALVLCEPVTCEATVYLQVPNPSSYIAMASRGLFVYDWAHPGNRDSFYELAARPLRPVQRNALSLPLQKRAIQCEMPDMQFELTEAIEVKR